MLFRFKKEMWTKIANEMKMPWRAIEAMHWELGREEMAERANTTPFRNTPNSGASPPFPPVSPGLNPIGPHGSYAPEVMPRRNSSVSRRTARSDSVSVRTSLTPQLGPVTEAVLPLSAGTVEGLPRQAAGFVAPLPAPSISVERDRRPHLPSPPAMEEKHPRSDDDRSVAMSGVSTGDEGQERVQ